MAAGELLSTSLNYIECYCGSLVAVAGCGCRLSICREKGHSIGSDLYLQKSSLRLIYHTLPRRGWSQTVKSIILDQPFHNPSPSSSMSHVIQNTTPVARLLHGYQGGPRKHLQRMMVLILFTLFLNPAAAGSLTKQEIYDSAKWKMHQAEGTSISRKRPAWPMHRSILEHRKRKVYSVESDTKRRSGENVTDKDSEYANSKDNLTGTDLEEDHMTSDLLSSPWWNRIHEDYGVHSYNFIPESRRAASSVVFRLIKERELENVDPFRTLNEINNDFQIVSNVSSIATNNSTNDSSASEGEEAHVDSKLAVNTNENSLHFSNATHFHLVAVKNATSFHEESNESDTNDVYTNIESNANTKLHQAYSTATAGKTNATDSTFTTQHPNRTKQMNDLPQSTNKVIDTKGEEYMIVSGGYTDHDWKTFPVYAFPLTSSISSGSGTWIDLSPLASELFDENSESWCKSRDNIKARDRLYQEAKYLKSDSTDPWKHADPCAPSGRMGHSSFIHNNYLYVFGGLIYDAEQTPTSGNHYKEAFRLEDVPYVYRLDLTEMFDVREVDKRRKASSRRNLEDIGVMENIESLLLEKDDDKDIESKMDMGEIHDLPNIYNKKVSGWQRIVPRVKPFESLDGMPAMAASEVLLKSINRGEMQGGMWNGKYVMYGGLRIVLSDVAGPHATSKVVKGASYSTAGSAQGSSRIIELPLGDVWAYDLETDAFEKVTNSYGKPEGVDTEEEMDDKQIEEEAENDGDDSWWKRLDNSMFPRPRTAHAATVVGDELVIHGGMGWDEHIDDWDGSTNWETLDDMWILNLKTLQWKRR